MPNKISEPLTPSEICLKIKSYFEENGLKQSDIAKILDVTQAAVSNQLNGRAFGINAAKKCHKAGIEVMALGFGSADYAFLKKIASTDEFASITDLSDLGGSFSKIAQAIGEGSTGLSVM